MKPPFLFVCTLLAGLATASAQSTSTSPSYSLLHAPAGDLGGGGRLTNAGATVTADVSVGDLASGMVSNVSAGALVTKGNLIGQLTDVTGLTLSSASPSTNEGGSVQFNALQTLDDATQSAVPATSVAWSASGPISGISAGGLATAAPVFQNTVATVQGVLGSMSATRTLTVVNLNSDNFGTFGNDGIDDDWQVLHFGQPPNANASPSADPDGDGRNNLMEFLSGFLPTDAASAFQFRILGYSGPGVMDFRLNKIIPGRTYSLKESANLIAPFVTVKVFSAASVETDKLIQDTGAPADRNFYIIEISRP